VTIPGDTGVPVGAANTKDRLYSVAVEWLFTRLASFNTKDCDAVRPAHTNAFEPVPTVR